VDQTTDPVKLQCVPQGSQFQVDHHIFGQHSC
jgi:hypothetical protein